MYKDTNTSGSLNIPKALLQKIGIDGRYKGVHIFIEDDKIQIQKAKCKNCGSDTIGTKSGGLVCENEKCKEMLYWK